MCWMSGIAEAKQRRLLSFERSSWIFSSIGERTSFILINTPRCAAKGCPGSCFLKRFKYFRPLTARMSGLTGIRCQSHSRSQHSVTTEMPGAQSTRMKSTACAASVNNDLQAWRDSRKGAFGGDLTLDQSHVHVAGYNKKFLGIIDVANI